MYGSDDSWYGILSRDDLNTEHVSLNLTGDNYKREADFVSRIYSTIVILRKEEKEKF